MTDKNFRQSLRETAREAIPDDFDRWSQIRSRAQAASPRIRPASPMLLSSRRIALVVLILLTSTVAYGVYQVTRPLDDPGLVGVQQAGYITELNLAQVVDGIEMQLDWAYIDEGRAVLHYQTFLVESDGVRRPADADMNFNARLIERNGFLPDLMPNRFNGSSTPQPITMTFYLPSDVDLQALPDTVDLRFEIVFEQRPHIQTVLERLFSPGVSTGATTFGTLPDLSSQATPEVTPTRAPLPAGFGPFIFDFTLPIRHAVSLRPMQIVTHSGVEMTLENVTVSPSKTDLAFSFTVPEGSYWSPAENRLLLGDIAVTPGGWDSIPGEDERIHSTIYFELYAQPPATLTFTVGALERHPSTPDEFREAQRELNARGIPMDLEFFPDGTVSSYSWPTGLESAKPALVELGYRIEGPWIFTVGIP